MNNSAVKWMRSVNASKHEPGWCVICGNFPSGPVVTTLAEFRARPGVICCACLLFLSAGLKHKRARATLALYERGFGKIKPTPRSVRRAARLDNQKAKNRATP